MEVTCSGDVATPETLKGCYENAALEIDLDDGSGGQSAPDKNKSEVPSMIEKGCTGDEQAPKGFGARHSFALTAFVGMICAYMLRCNLSVAIVDMVNRTQSSESASSLMYMAANLETDDSTCADSIEPAGQHHDGEFNWDGETQGLVLGVFAWGYMSSQVPAGMAAERWGGKLIFGLGVLLTGVFNVLTPLAARSSLSALLVVRVLTGMSEGITFPVMNSMLSRWVPKSERSTLAAFVFAGTQFGTVIAYPLTGYLCSIEWDNGWPLAFYVPGAISVVWFVFWQLLAFDGPEVHPRISQEEKRFIMASTARSQTKLNLSSIPWASLLTSVPFWAILVAHVGQNWGFYVMLTELPTYMKTVLKFDLQSNSLLSALPYLAMWILSMVFSSIADTLRNKNILNLTQTRKIFNTIGNGFLFELSFS